MHKLKLVLPVLVVLVTVLVIATVVLTSQNTNQIQGVSTQNQQTDQTEVRPIDQDGQFIVMMIDHHQMAIEASKQAVDKSTDPKIIELAKKIINDQQDEIFLMRNYYRAWYNSQVPLSNIDHQSHQSSSYSDQDYLSEMIVHHTQAVDDAKNLLNQTKRVEMKQLAENIIKTQTQEIELMQSMLLK